MVDLEATLRSALAGRYSIETELGRGGMSVVFRARDEKHNRDVAIKVLRPELSEHVGVDRFQREVEFAATLTDPHILPLFDSGDAAGSLFYVMPFIEGGSLADRLARDGRLEVEEAVHIARDVARALAAAHDHGIVHRDIKPGNILFSGGDAVVSDFGIAKAVEVEGDDRLTQSGLSIGSPAFMSPEQAVGDAVDGRADVYSLGCVLYAMLTGAPPFVRSTAQATIAAHLAEAPPSAREARPEVPKGVDEIIRTALQKEPGGRFATAGEMIAALEHPELMPERAKALRRRRRARAGAWTLATAVGVAGIGFLAWRAFGPESLPEADSNRVMVFPLMARGDLGPEAGHDAAIFIENVLVHADPLKFLDGWTWLSADERADPSLVTAGIARRVALRQRARFFVTGTVHGFADSATVSLQLHDAVGDTSVAREVATGTPDASGIADAGQDATTRFLPALLEPGRVVDPAILAASRSSSPVAMLEWVEGEKAYRASRFEEALRHYERALDADSAWSFAAMKAAQAASWLDLEDGATALGFVEDALRNRDLLPPKYAALADGLRAYLTGESAESVVQLERALGADPEWAEAWTALGETYYHLMPDWQDTGARAEGAFRRSWLADSSFVVPLYHLTEIAIRRGSVDTAQAWIDRYRLAQPDAEFLVPLDIALACVRDGPGFVDWETIAGVDPASVAEAAQTLSVGALQWECAEAALAAVLSSESATRGWRWGSAFTLSSLWLARGRIAEALALVDSMVAAGETGAYALYPVYAVAGFPVFRERGAEAMAMLPEPIEELGIASVRFVGQWAAMQGYTERLAAVAATANELADPSAPSDLSLAAGLDAQLALLRGDSARALEILVANPPRGTRKNLTWDTDVALPHERLLLAELLLARGDYERAAAVADGFDGQSAVYLCYLPRSLTVRAAAAAAADDGTRADRYRERAARLRGSPDAR